MAVKKKTAKKAVKKAAKKAAASPAAAKAPTKSEIFSTVAADNGLTRAQVAGVFDSLAVLVKKNVGKRGPGTFTIPGLAKVVVRTKPATKARKGTNPFTGEEMTFKAKPARKVVKVTPLKALKDMA
jgi:nucleoid DNA-binding protein